MGIFGLFMKIEDNARIMVEERCINDVVSALERHINSVPLVTAASITLLSLLLEGRQTLSKSLVKVSGFVLYYGFLQTSELNIVLIDLINCPQKLEKLR